MKHLYLHSIAVLCADRVCRCQSSLLFCTLIHMDVSHLIISNLPLHPSTAFSVVVTVVHLACLPPVIFHRLYLCLLFQERARVLFSLGTRGDWSLFCYIMMGG